MRKRYRAGLVGLGKQAREDHIPGLVESHLAELTAVCDIDQTLCDEIGADLGVPAYTDYMEMFEREDLDFVIIAAPHVIHHEIVEAAAKASLHILKEKPFAMSLKEALHIKDLAQDQDIEVMTTLQRRFNPIYTSYFQLADQIGQPFFVDVQYTMYVDHPHTGWRGSREAAGGGCLIDMGYHMLDLIIWYLGMPDAVVATISAQAISDEVYDAEDTASLLFKWPSGMHGTCTLSRFLPPKTESLRVVGTRGVVELERGAIRRLANSGEVREELIRDRSWTVAASSQVDYFCRVLAGERQNIGGPQYHLQHAAVIDAAYESVQTESFVDPRKAL